MKELTGNTVAQTDHLYRGELTNCNTGLPHGFVLVDKLLLPQHHFVLDNVAR